MKKRFTAEGWKGILKAQTSKGMTQLTYMEEIHRLMRENPNAPKRPPKAPKRPPEPDPWLQQQIAERQHQYIERMHEAWATPQYRSWTSGVWGATIATHQPATEPAEMQEFDQPQSDFT